jgi:hypothetical protein
MHFTFSPDGHETHDIRCFLGLLSEQILLTYRSIREKEEEKCWARKEAPVLHPACVPHNPNTFFRRDVKRPGQRGRGEIWRWNHRDGDGCARGEDPSDEWVVRVIALHVLPPLSTSLRKPLSQPGSSILQHLAHDSERWMDGWMDGWMGSRHALTSRLKNGITFTHAQTTD